MSERSQRAALVGAALPGLAIFDAAPLVVPHDGVVRRIRLRLQEREFLHLNGLTIHSPAMIDPERLAPRMSSILEKKGGEPADLLHGRPIHTRKEDGPFWEVDFPEPVPIRAVEIRNRQGWRAGRAGGLLVEFEDAAGGVTRFDNLAPEMTAQRLAEARQAGQELADLARERAETAAFTQAWDGLLDLTESALASGEVTREALAEARPRAMEAILDLLRTLEGPVLGRAIHVAARLMVMLIQRGRAVRRGPGDLLETRAFAVYATSLLMRRKSRKIANRELYNFRSLYKQERLIPHLEQDMASLYLRATGDAASLPFMVRVHGISGPSLQRRAEAYLAAMGDVEAALRQLGYEGMILYGTLLGAVREGGFIAHDDDVDMGVALKTDDALAEVEALHDGLKKLGFGCRIINRDLLLRVTHRGRKVSMDLFPIIPSDENTVCMFMEGMKLLPVRRDLMLPVGRISFLGHEFGAPARPEGFLEARYGADWRTPRRKVGNKLTQAEEEDAEEG